MMKKINWNELNDHDFIIIINEIKANFSGLNKGLKVIISSTRHYNIEFHDGFFFDTILDEFEHNVELINKHTQNIKYYENDLDLTLGRERKATVHLIKRETEERKKSKEYLIDLLNEFAILNLCDNSINSNSLLDVYSKLDNKRRLIIKIIYSFESEINKDYVQNDYISIIQHVFNFFNKKETPYSTIKTEYLKDCYKQFGIPNMPKNKFKVLVKKIKEYPDYQEWIEYINNQESWGDLLNKNINEIKSELNDLK